MISVNRKDAEGKVFPSYTTWDSMKKRCRRLIAYKDATICDEWSDYETFKDWYDKNYYSIENEKMEIDKDILIQGNKVYSPETCIFVPQRINLLFVGRNRGKGVLPLGVSYNCGGYRSRCNCLDKVEFLGRYPTPIMAFTIYRTFKENYIKEVADKYKDTIPERLYKAMYEYKVQMYN